MDQGIKLLLSFLQADEVKIKVDTSAQLSPFKWDNVIEKSLRHGVAPIFYQRVKRIYSKSPIPFTLERKLHDLYMKNLAKNMVMYYNLAKLFRKFQDSKIPVIVLKGAYLAEVVYGDIALRFMHDADILLRESDFSKAEDKLLELGFIPDEHNPSFAEKNIKHHRIPAPGLSFAEPNLPFLIREVEALL